jgi:hypothetical protein
VLAIDSEPVMVRAQRHRVAVVRLLAFAGQLFADRKIVHAKVRRLGLAPAERQAARLLAHESEVLVVSLAWVALAELAH